MPRLPLRSRPPVARRSPGPGPRDRGAALILALLVLAILVVLVVQFAFSVKIEERIVQNTEDDAAMEFAARGAVPFLAALFRDDRKNGNPAGDQDTLGDVWCDPGTPEQRKITVGDVELELEVEDLERRLPLLWLADPRRKDAAELALRRLLEALAPVEGLNAEATAKQIAETVRQLQGVAEDGSNADEALKVRRLHAIEQLLGQGGEGEGGGGEGGGGEEGGGAALDRRILYGDPEAEPPTQGIAPFVTTWPVTALNLNTVLPEVLLAILPEKDKAPEPRNLWEVGPELVDAIRKHRIDPTHDQQPPADGSQPADQGTMGASKSWRGQPFTKVDELQNEAIHERLKHVFSADGQPGAGGAPAGGGTPAGGGGASGGQAGQGAEPLAFRDLLTVRSRFFMVRMRARAQEGAEATFRALVYRSNADEVSVLFLKETPR